MLDDREVFGLMDAATVAGLVLDRQQDSLFDFVAEAQAGGFLPHRAVQDFTAAEAERLRNWMRGCATVARNSDDAEWLSGHVIVRMCEARRAIDRRDFAEAMLRVRQAEFTGGVLAKLLQCMDDDAADRMRADCDPDWRRIEGWR